jgi:hypothetical protein
MRKWITVSGPEHHVGEAHDVSHLADRRALQRKALSVTGVRISAGAAPPEHRVLLLRLAMASPMSAAYSFVLKSLILTMTGFGW